MQYTPSGSVCTHYAHCKCRTSNPQTLLAWESLLCIPISRVRDGRGIQMCEWFCRQKGKRASEKESIHSLQVGKFERRILKVLKTLFNIVEARLKKYLLNFDVCVVWWCPDGSLNSQEYKRYFEIDAYVSIKIPMTEYHQLINLISLTVYSDALRNSLWVKMSMINPVTYLFSHIWST